jgi:HK97 family phage major capsid protein
MLEQTKEKIADLQDEVQAIVNLAENDDRELNDDESTRVDECLAEIQILRENEQRLEKVESEKQRVALARQPQKQDAPKILPAIPKAKARLHAFKGEQAERDAYHAGQWIKAQFLNDAAAKQFCNDHGLILGAQTGGTNADGGFLVPDPLSDAIIDVRDSVGVARQISRVIPMTSDTLSVPKRSGGLTIDYPSEAGSITASDKAWANVSLAVKKQATLSKVSNELLADAVINVADDLASEIGFAFAQASDNELINGDGSSTYGSETGVISALGAAGKVTLDSGETSQSSVTLADLHSVAGKLGDKHHAQAVWVMNRSFYSNVVQKLVYAAGGNTVSDIAGGSGASLFGYQVYLTEHMPADAADKCIALFGAFVNGVVIGDRDGVEIAMSDSVYFADDCMGIRATARNDINVHDAGDGSAAGAIVGLFTAAS